MMVMFLLRTCFVNRLSVVILTPAEDTAGDLEYDEDDLEFYKGDREV